MPTGGGSIQIVRIFGIRIGASLSWFVVLFFFIWILTGRYRTILDASETVVFVTAVASALLFFASIVLHELGHALVARREGFEIAGVDLWFFGGIAKLDRDSRTPGEEFRVAAAGPLVTLAIFGGCIGIAALIGGDVLDAALLREDATVTPLGAMLAFLVLMNALLFVFNLLPAYPLDGGRIARALAWRLGGDRGRATRISAWMGQAFSYVLIGLGIYLLVFADAPFSGLWMAVLGWLLAQSARSAVVQTAVTERLEGITVADVMDAEPVTIPAGTSAVDAREQWFDRYGWPWFGVVDAYGRFAGLLREDDVAAALADGRGHADAGSLVSPGSEQARVAADEPIESLLGSARLREDGALFAVEADGTLRGVVTVEQVRRALAAALPVGG